jgi:hypothetical protein
MSAVGLGLVDQAYDFFQSKKLMATKPIPIIERSTVGVKLPESGWGKGVAETVAAGVGVSVAEGLAPRGDPSG